MGCCQLIGEGGGGGGGGGMSDDMMVNLSSTPKHPRGSLRSHNMVGVCKEERPNPHLCDLRGDVFVGRCQLAGEVGSGER